MKRAGPLILSALAAAGLAAAAAVGFDPVMVWNGSKSAPRGLYRVHERTPKIGEFALVDPPARIAALIAERGYLPPGTPLIKRVAALEGDVVCREHEVVLINGEVAAKARLADRKGRAMPEWRGCIALGERDIFLLNDHPESFDGRYFGAVDRRRIIGVASPLRVFD